MLAVHNSIDLDCTTQRQVVGESNQCAFAHHCESICKALFIFGCVTHEIKSENIKKHH